MLHKIPTIKMHPVVFSILVSVYFFFFLNLPLLNRLYEIMQSGAMSLGFTMSLPIFFIGFFNLLFVPFSNNRLRKAVFITLVLFSSAISYATYQYGIIFNREMIGNFLETNQAEALSYLNLSVFFWMAGFGVIPAILIWKTEVVALPRKKVFLSQLYSFMASMLLISLVAAVYYQDYVVTWRNNSDIKRIIVPTYAASSGVKYFKHRYLEEPLPYTQQGLDAHFLATNSGKRKLTVIVVGETARAANYSYNGYAKDTNRFTREQGVHYFKNVTSCGTETSVSVPCMFSNLTREGYSEQKAAAQDNLVDILKRAGVETLWLENNGGCKGVCKNANTVDIRKVYAGDKKYCGAEGCYDGALVEELKKQLPGLQGKNTVVFLHLMGSHGPSYYKRYPPEMTIFKPTCQRGDIQNCGHAELINTYDNTIAYTDKLLADIIGVLRTEEGNLETSMLYLSDHGESLGESGVYLHGLPYSIAPAEQKEIPMMTWVSSSAAAAQHLKTECLSHIGEKGVYSQDNFFHTVLGMSGVVTQVYKADMDILGSCRESKIVLEERGMRRL